MNCPRCKTPLASEEPEEPGSAQRCGACHGMWVFRKAFRDAAEEADQESGWLAFELWNDAERFRGAPGDLLCPNCGKGMPRLAYGDASVHVDVCAECGGAWLDAREFEQTVAALRTELTRIPTSSLLHGAFDEAAEIAREGGSIAEEWKHISRVARLLELRLLADHPQLRRILISLQGGSAFP